MGQNLSADVRCVIMACHSISYYVILVVARAQLEVVYSSRLPKVPGHKRHMVVRHVQGRLWRLHDHR